MNRITKKRTDGFYELTAKASDICTKEGGLVQVVGQYEDVEETVGMPLERLVSMHKNGFWAIGSEKDNFDLIEVKSMKDVEFDFDKKEIIVYYECDDIVYNTYKFND